MSELDDLEEIARQATIRVNEKTRNSRSGGGLAYAPQANIVRAAIHAAHPPAPASPVKPADLPPEPVHYPDDPFGPSKPVTSYTELITGIKTQVEALGVRQLDFDRLAGFPAGLSGKAFGLLQVKRLGPEKLFDALRAAGLRLRLEVDPEQMALMKARIDKKLMHPRQANQSRPGHCATLPSTAVLSRVLRPIGRIGGQKRWAGKSRKKRSEHGSLMANARWSKVRRARKAKRLAAAHRAANEETRAT